MVRKEKKKNETNKEVDISDNSMIPRIENTTNKGEAVKLTRTLTYVFHYNEKTDEFRPMYQPSGPESQVLSNRKQVMLSFLITNIKYRKLNKMIEKVFNVMIVLVSFLILSIVAWFVFLFMHKVVLLENDMQVSKLVFPVFEYIVGVMYQFLIFILSLMLMIDIKEKYTKNFTKRINIIVSDVIRSTKYLNLYDFKVEYKHKSIKQVTISITNKK